MISTLLMLIVATQHPDGGVAGHGGKNKIVEPKAKSIVVAMLKAYATCKTYVDTGTTNLDTLKISFITRYKRPDRLYFEFTSSDKGKSSRFVLWAGGVRKRLWFNGVDGPGYWDNTILTNSWYGDRGEFEKDKSLGMSIAGFTGISAGAACTVPTMLFPREMNMLCLTDMADLKWEKTQMDRGVKCDVVYSSEHNIRSWIDQKTHLLRKTSEHWSEDNSDQITLYNPRVDVPIKDAQMTFTPPRK